MNEKIKTNATKVAYLVSQYPEHNLTQIIGMFRLPAVDINAAIWAAQELGYISEPTEDGTVEVISLPVPEDLNFGEAQKELEDAIVYSFAQLAKKEQDLEENYFSEWTAGYDSQDIFITVKKLISEHKLAEYELTDPNDLESTYKFYTSYENGEQMWGRKQFKQEPVGDEKPAGEEAVEAPDLPTEE